MNTKQILITGASRGIGRATAIALAQPGATLTVAARSAEALAGVAAEAQQRGALARAVPTDLTEPTATAALIAQASAERPLDLVVHSVGGALVAPFNEITLAAWEEQLRSQLTSAFILAQAASPQLAEGALLIFIGSVADRQVFPGWAAYCAAKHGLRGLVGALREELRPRRIRVALVSPAATDTELWAAVPGEWNRANMLRAEEVAAVIANLASQPPHLTVEELTVGHVVGRL